MGVRVTGERGEEGKPKNSCSRGPYDPRYWQCSRRAYAGSPCYLARGAVTAVARIDSNTITPFPPSTTYGNFPIALMAARLWKYTVHDCSTASTTIGSQVWTAGSRIAQSNSSLYPSRLE